MNGREIRVYCGVDPEKGEAGVTLAEDTDAFEITQCLRKIEGAAVLGDHKGAGREKRSGAKKGEDAVIFIDSSVRRIEENDVEKSACRSVFRGEALQSPQSVELENSRAAENAERIEILLNEGGSGRMVFDEHRFSGTATEGFDADGAGAGEDVEEAATGDAFSQDVEK